MALHNAVGTEGENIAAAWLTEKGYQVMFRNWRHSHYEIDIIALKDKMLHFIEVKCFTSMYKSVYHIATSCMALIPASSLMV